MKILALNGSPRGEGQSKTEMLLNCLAQGMREAGAEVEVVDLRKKKIRFCAGCYTCWTKTPGVCIHQDDMSKELFPKWLASDLVVYAFPLYHFTVNAATKAFIERTLPVAQPYFERHGDRIFHPHRHTPPKAVFLSVAGLPEMSVFDQLSTWVQFLFGKTGMGTLVAELYRPAAENLPVLGKKADTVLDAFQQAGLEIVRDLQVSSETMAQISQDYVADREKFALMGNLYWKSCITEGITPKEFSEKKLIPRPDSLETFMIIQSVAFRPEAAQGLTANIQFRFSGEVKGNGYLHIENGQIRGVLGEAEKADLVIDTPFEVWMDILTQKADGQQLFMEQKYQVSGDLELLMKLGRLFGR
ncbi:MAG TPA: NAD(P)H-dependent oxidoreductase [Thermodesulfobacteriota bacterium]|nr:NAD(P)H-dependent oxidoreductase [Thermodesulfobacteriota bacterium]